MSMIVGQMSEVEKLPEASLQIQVEELQKIYIYISFEHLEGIYIGGLYGQIYIYCLKRSLGQTWRMKKSKLRSQIELGIISLVEVGGGGSDY